MRRRDPFKLAQALDELTNSIQPTTLLARIQRAWPEAVGETVAEWAAPVSERAGVVTLECSDSIVAHELEMMKTQVLEQLAAQLGEGAGSRAVSDLRFRVR